jgi:hypothetical protein
MHGHIGAGHGSVEGLHHLQLYGISAVIAAAADGLDDSVNEGPLWPACRGLDSRLAAKVSESDHLLDHVQGERAHLAVLDLASELKWLPVLISVAIITAACEVG